MREKLKLKFTTHKFYFILLFCILAIGFFTAHKVSATSYPLGNLNLTLNIQVGTSTGNLLPQKFVRVGADGNLVIKGILTLNTPNQINIGVDKISGPTNGISNAINNYFAGDALITNFGLGLLQSSGGSTGGGVGCQQSGSADYHYVVCPFLPPPLSVATQGNSTVNARQNILSQNLIIPGSKFQDLGMYGTNDPLGKTYYLVLYPFIGTSNKDYTFSFSDNRPATFDTMGQSIVVQVFQTQAMADAANAQFGTQPPVGTPSYGPTSGSATTSNNNGLLNIINQIIGFVLGLLQELAYAIFFYLVAPLIEALLQIHPYMDAFVQVIYPGWIVVRNLSNIIFIVALIAIGVATLLRIESYQYKHLLVQLVLAALLVNFSLVIGQAILGVADTVQSQFLGNNVTQIRTLASTLMTNSNVAIINNFSGTQNTNAVATNQTVFAGIIQSIFWLALSWGTLAVFLAICAYLFIRIVMLWILLMISPIAYAAGVLPSTEHYRKEWWDNFLKYAFFTPIMAFFLNMTAIMANNVKNNPVFSQALNGTSVLTSGPSAVSNSLAGLVISVGSDVLLLVFLIVSLMVAEKAGIYGASAISGWAKKGMFAPFQGAGFLAKRGGGYVGRKYNEWTAGLVTQEHGAKGIAKKAAFAVLNPVNFLRGWGERSKERTEQAHELAKGAGLTVASELLTGGRERIDYKQLAMQKIQRQYASKLKESMGDDVGRAAAMDIQRRVLHVKGFEGEMLRGAVALLTGDYGWGDDTNEIPSSPEERNKLRADLKAKGASEGQGLKLFDEACETYNDQGFETMQWAMQGLDLNMLYKLRNNNEDNAMYRRDSHGQFVDKDMGKFVANEKNQRALMNMAALTDGAKKVGHYEQMFLSKKDEKTGFFIPLVDAKGLSADKAMRSSEIMGEVKKIDIRNFLRQTAPHNFLNKNKRYETKKDPVTGKEYVEESWERGPVGKGGEKLTVLQRAIWKQVGSKYVARSAESQARIISDLAGKYVEKDGSIKPETAQEFLDIIELNPEFVDGLRNVEISGAPYIGKVGSLDTNQLIREAQLTITVKTKPGTSEATAAEAELKQIVNDRLKTINEQKSKKKKAGEEED